MADYFTQFAALLPLRSDEQMAVAMDLYREFAAEPEHDAMVEFSVEADAIAPGLFLWSDESGDTEQVIEFVRRCAIHCQLSGRWGFSWSSTCSRPRIDGFSSGAVIIDLGTGEVVDEITIPAWIESRVGLGLQPLPDPNDPAGRLDVSPVFQGDNRGFELVDCTTGTVAAVVHDGPDRPNNSAQGIADLLAEAPVMLSLLCEGLAINREQFEGDIDADDGDLIENMDAWRQKVLRTLQIGRPAASADKPESGIEAVLRAATADEGAQA